MSFLVLTILGLGGYRFIEKFRFSQLSFDLGKVMSSNIVGMERADKVTMLEENYINDDRPVLVI